MSVNLKNSVLPVTTVGGLLTVAILGGLAWGQATTKIEVLDNKVNKNELALEKIQEIWREQGVIKNRLDTLDRDQKEFRKDTKRTLEEVLSHLRSRR